MSTIKQFLETKLRERIVALGVGAKFPTDAELCNEFAVSRMTVYKVVKQLADEGLLSRHRRRGTYVRSVSAKAPQSAKNALLIKDMKPWLERGNPIRTVFAAHTYNFLIYIDECSAPHRRRMWEEILTQVEERATGVKFTITTRASDASYADLALFCLRFGAIEHIADDPQSVQAIKAHCPHKNYFASAWHEVEKLNFACCPFAVSTNLYVWNLPLLQHHFPDFSEACPTRVVDFIQRHKAWDSKDFPPIASFMFYPPIQWMTEGLDFSLGTKGTFDLDNEELRRHLLFNRHMLKQAQALCGGKASLDALMMWKLFNSGSLLAINTFSSTLSIMPPRRKEQYVVCSPKIEDCVVIVPVYLGIGRACRNPEKAAELIGLICGTSGQSCLVRHYGNIPALRQAAYSPEFLDNSPLHMRQVLQCLDKGKPVMEQHPFLLKEQPHYENFARYMLGEIDLSELARIVKNPPFSINEKLPEQPHFRNQKSLQTCYLSHRK
jgi:DNA-binding transcriptional regulator YhcF (GntR family)